VRRPAALALLLALALSAAGCGGDGNQQRSDDEASRPLTVWIEENQPDRVRTTRDNVADFTRRTGIDVDLVPLGDDELLDRVAAADRADSLPDVLQISLADARAFADRGILDTSAAQQVVVELGEQTFSARALGLLTSGGSVAAVPSDGWGQLLIYRKDLFDRAGLPMPDTLERVRAAARRLTRRGMAGITLATKGGDAFMAETFEHIALAAGCQLVDAGGDVRLDSAGCRRAFSLYVELARKYSPGGVQDVESTRDTYFAGKAAMILWSPFLLDAMAGLNDEATPSCPQCRKDPAYLAKNSGLLGPLASADAPPAQFGTISTWGIGRGAGPGAQRFVRYMLSDGYLRWLSISPQGKYPVRAGDAEDLDRYARGWAELESGIDRRAPLSRFYSAASIASLADGVRRFQRWGFAQDQAELVGALSESEPVAEALGAAIRGDLTPDQAAQKAQSAVEQLQESIR
jgi:multiple sugar transport system substrate-binding protein